MYKIIGVDGQHYGPVTAEQLRRWIVEKRANALSSVQVEGSLEWKPLGSLPEFAADLNPPPSAAIPAAGAVPPTVASRAGSKIAAGICGILLGSFGIHKFVLGYTGAGLIMLLVSLLTCFMAAPVMHIIGLIEGIVYLTKSDEEFVRIYVDGRREWF